MVWFTFDVTLAFDATSRTPASGATALVYAESDTGKTTPLATQDLNGLPLTLTASQDGFLPSFRVDGHPRVRFVSGPFDQIITAGTSLVLWAQESASAAQASAAAAVASADSVAALQKWVDLGITRRNLLLNPSFGTDAASWTPTGCTFARGTTTRPDLVGTHIGIITVASATGSPFVAGIAEPAIVSPGQWVAVRMLAGRSTGATHARVSIQWFAGSTGLAFTSGPIVALSGTGFTLLTASGVAPDTATTARLLVYPVASAGGGTPPDGNTFIDAGLLVVGATQAEALAGIAEYFDGDTPSTQYRANRWSGTPHASVSEQLDMTAITDQQLPPGGSMGQALVKVSGADRDVAWGTVSGGGGGTSVHGLLSGLDQDDHPQYLNNSRGDARYYTKSQVDTAVNNAAVAQSANDRNRANHTGTQPIASIAGLQPILDGLGGTAVNSVAGKTGTVVLVSSDISDTGATGREIMGATTPAAVRTAAGAAATSHTHTASQVGATATGQGLMTAMDAAAARGVIGAGTSSVELGTTSTTAMRGNFVLVDPVSVPSVGTYVVVRPPV